MKALLLRLRLLVLALALGAALVFVGNAATDIVLGRMPLADGTLGSIDAPDVAIIHMVFTTLPMIVLALWGSRSKLLWRTAVLLTAGFSAFATWSIWHSSLSGFEGGADIGLGLIMLASPCFILLVLGVIGIFGRRRRVSNG